MLKHLKISRPGLWFPTIWMYLVPFQLSTEFWLEPIFWLGLVFCTFPLNYLVYGLNDYKDYEADAINARKGNYLFGARLSKQQLRHVPITTVVVLLPFVIVFTVISGFKMFLLLAFMVLVNIVYNFKPFRFKERPPLEIFIQIGYVFTALFSIELNNLSMLPWQTFLYLTLFAFQAHIAGEIMDIEPDRSANKKTTATVLGRKKTKLIMLLLLLAETYILWFWYKDAVLAGFLGVFALWLIMDIFIFFKDRPYTLKQMKFFGFAINVSALLSMVWILYAGKLLSPLF